MYKNYFLFEKQLQEIKPYLLGKSITNVFTYKKNEIVIELSDPDPLFLLINVSNHLPYFFAQPTFSVRQPKYQLFQELYDQAIYNIYIRSFDKHITLELEKNKIIIVFYGKQPNIFIMDSDETTINSFKSGAMPSFLPAINSIDFRNSNLELYDFHSVASIETYLKSKFTALNKTIINEIIFRCKHLNNMPDSLILNQVLSELSEAMNLPGAYLYWQSKILKKISLFRLFHLEVTEEYEYQHFDILNTAWKRFVSEQSDQKEYDKLYKMCASAIKKKKDYLEQSLKQIEQLKDLKQQKKIAELKGNLLLTFKNQIKLDRKEVILENIFSNDLEKIHIKINPNKTVTENAKIYFNKYKDLVKHRFVHSVKKKTLQNDFTTISDINNNINSVKNLSTLKKFHQKLIEMNLLQADIVSSPNAKPRNAIFRHLILEPDWDVYIGKSGENNDELTFKFANKQDYWFHAQGVPGSHVILKSKQKDQAPPNKILEQVSGIAAANSKARHSATVPVIYTQVRYVSRIRNAPKGTVNTRNEKTLFVEPLNIS